MLDLRRLRALHAVSRHGSVAAAAAAMGYSGPAVSQQLAALEREVGVPLTERRGRGIALTAVADVLVAHTDVVFTQLAAAESDLAQFKGEVTGVVTVAAFPSAAAALLPTAWAAVSAGAPHVRIELKAMEPEESLLAVLQNRADVAVAHSYDLVPRPLDAQYETRMLLDDPVLVAVPGGSEETLLDTIELSTLSERPFLVPRAGTSCAELVNRACARAGFVPRVVARANDFDVLLSLVAAGLGVALVPQLAARHVPPTVSLVPPSTSLTRTIFAVSARGGLNRPTVRVVLDALAGAARARSTEGRLP